MARNTVDSVKNVLLIGLAVIIVLIWTKGDRHHPPQIEHNEPAQIKQIIPRGSLAEDEKNSIDIFKSNARSVVYITSIQLRREWFSLNVYKIPQGTGTGFVWDKKGRIVTNYHVIQGAGEVDVTLADNSVWKAKIVGIAEDKDIAVLDIDAPENVLFPIQPGTSGNLLVGQKVFAIGNPFGLDQTMTSGIVSALDREIEAVSGRTIQGVIQTDAAINPGNSGGPLLDSSGLLIGVNTAIYSPSGTSAGIGFAVPADVVIKVVSEIIEYGKVIKPGLGITVASERITRRLDIDGVLIVEVIKGSAAQKAGLEGSYVRRGQIVLGDIIVEVNGKTVSSYNEYRNEIEKHNVGDTVDISIIRNKRKKTLNIQLEEIN